jgi:hypothetical protein
VSAYISRCPNCDAPRTSRGLCVYCAKVQRLEAKMRENPDAVDVAPIVTAAERIVIWTLCDPRDVADQVTP